MGKCGGHELNYVSDVDVIFVYEPVEGADDDGRRPGRDPAGQPPDAGLLGPHRRGHDLAGRRRPAARGQGRAAGAHPGQPPRLLRAVGEHLGVPGAAQGPAGRRRPRAGAASTSRWSRRWCGRPPSATASSRTPRRCGAGSSSTSRPTRPSGSSSSGPAGCATSSSPSSCSSWCTAAPTSGSGAPTTLSALAELTRGGYVGREDGEALHDAYAFLRTLEHRIQLHRLRRTHVVPEDEPSLRRLGRSLGLHQGPGRRPSTRPGSTTAARCAGCTRSCSTGRCSPPSPGCPAPRPGCRRRPRATRLAALGFADPDAALRHLEALTAGVTRTVQHPADAAAGDARVVRRGTRPGRRAVRLPPDQRVARPHAVVPQDAARRGRGRPAAGHAARAPRATPPACSRASRRACGCWGRTSSRCPPRR